MAFPVENWGALKIVTGVKQEGGSGAADVVLSSMPKGNEKTNPNFVSKTMLKVPISSIASAAGTTKNDLSINLRSKASHTPATDLELTSIRFAVPNVCVGYEQTEEAGREILQNIHSKMKEYQQSYLKEHGQGSDDNNLLVLATMGASTTAHADEKVIATFDDVPVAYPSGKYKIVLSNYNVVLEDKRKTATGLLTFPLSDVQQLYLCDIPSYFGKGGGEDDTGLAQYVVLVLRNPMKVRSTSYAHVVISCPPELVLHADHPWRCELKTQEEINKVLGFAEQESGEYPLVPSMSGRVSEIMIRTFKAVAKVPAFGGLNKEYRSVLTQQRHSCLRCMYKSSEGFLFVANKGLLFLHRPAVKIDYSDIDKIEMDESDSGTATFQISVMAKTSTGTEKLVFSSLDKAEKDGLLAFLGTKVKLERFGLEGEAEDDDDDDDDDEEGNEDSDDDDDDDSDDFDESDDGSDDGGSDDEDEDGKSSRKRDRKHRSSDKDKKHKHAKKKHRHHKKEKKE